VLWLLWLMWLAAVARRVAVAGHPANTVTVNFSFNLNGFQDF
jgi:hypothetical protein